MRLFPAFSLAGVLLCSGCAAIGTRIVGSYPSPYFSGVRGDAAMIGNRQSIDPASRYHPVLAMIDMPFSLVADILFLPRDACAPNWNQRLKPAGKPAAIFL